MSLFRSCLIKTDCSAASGLICLICGGFFIGNILQSASSIQRAEESEDFKMNPICGYGLTDKSVSLICTVLEKILETRIGSVSIVITIY